MYLFADNRSLGGAHEIRHSGGSILSDGVNPQMNLQ